MRRAFLALVWLLAISTAAFAQEVQDGSGELREIVRLFDILGLPSVAGKKAVMYNPGGYAEGDGEFYGFRYTAGWVLSESEKDITILDTGLVKNTYNLKHDLPSRWYKYKHKHPKDMPLPGYYKELDFTELCNKYIEGKIEKKSALHYFLRGGGSGGSRAALFAYWAHQRGMKEMSLRLVEFGKRIEENSIPQGKREGVNFSSKLLGSVTEYVASKLKRYTGLSRPELLKNWKAIAGLSANKFSEEAREIVPILEKMVTEDEEWKEPSKEEFAGMKAAEKAQYWIYKLRDADTYQLNHPGYGHVLRDRGREESNPARYLLKLGWDAIPVLIEHFYDPRLTRCVGYNRSRGYVLRYGQCCQQIFETITGYRLHREPVYTVREWKKPGLIKKAQEWWDKLRIEGAEKFYFDVLQADIAYKYEGDIEERLRMDLAIDWLLQKDRDKYMPKILGLAGENPKTKYKLLRVIGPKLGKEQQKWLESFLEFENLDAVCVAAKTLWEQCEADVGAKKVIGLLKNSARAQKDSDFCAMALYMVLAKVQKDFVIDAISEFAKQESPRLKWETIGHAFMFPDKRVLEALIALLDDKGFSPWEKEYRYCDLAAFKIHRMVNRLGKYHLYAPVEKRDLAIVELKAWLQENKDKLDWEKLRQTPEKKQ